MLSLRSLIPAALLVTALSATVLAAPRAPSAHTATTGPYSLVISERTAPGKFRVSGKEWGSTFTGRVHEAPRKGVKAEEVRRYQAGGTHQQTNRSITYTNGWKTTNVKKADGTALRITSRGGRSTTREFAKDGALVRTWKSGKP